MRNLSAIDAATLLKADERSLIKTLRLTRVRDAGAMLPLRSPCLFLPFSRYTLHRLFVGYDETNLRMSVAQSMSIFRTLATSANVVLHHILFLPVIIQQNLKGAFQHERYLHTAVTASVICYCPPFQ